MAQHKEPHIKKASTRSKVSDNEAMLLSAGGKLADDTNPSIVALSAGLIAAGEAIGTSIVNQKTKHDEALVSTDQVKQDNKDGCDAYNAAAKKVEEVYPGNTSKWADLGFSSTLAVVPDQTPPDKVENCKMFQSEYAKQCEVRYDPTARALSYIIKITKDAPLDASKYIIIEEPTTSFTSASVRIVIPDAYLNVPIWIKVTASNGAGKGPSSEPFGGRIIQ